MVSLYDKSIYNRGNVFDLVFSNVLSVEAYIEDHLDTGSNYWTLITTLPSRFRVGGLKLDLSPDNTFIDHLTD